MRERTTKKQHELLSYLDAFIKSHGYSPSYREIMQALGYKSVSTVSTHIQGLIARGYVKKSADEARSLEIIPPPSATDDKEAWIKQKIANKIRALDADPSFEAKRDSAALHRAAQLLGLE